WSSGRSCSWWAAGCSGRRSSPATTSGTPGSRGRSHTPSRGDAMRGLLAGVAVLGLASVGRAADVPAHRNAALQYWIAFEFLPSYNNLPKERQRLFDEWETVPFTPENVEIL